MLLVATGCNRANNPDRFEPPLPPSPVAEVESGAAEPEESSITPAAHVPRSGPGDADALLTNATLLRLEIEIPRAGLSVLRRTHWGNGVERPVVKGVVHEGGVTYSDVAIHLKGSAGSFRSVDDKPALTLSFSKFVPGQEFHGMKKISLNNSVQDSSYLCEKISRELCLAADVPVPRAAHALVRLNGRDLGLYVLLEGANKQFLKRYFRNATGNLYDGGFCRDISLSLDVNCGDDPKNNSGLKALVTAMRQRPDFARLEKVLDVDRFISMVVMEMMLCHWDGYSLNRNNWRIFHDLESNRMVFIPHGLDQLFGLGGQFNPGSPLMPLNAQGDVTRAVLATQEGQARYRERFAEIYTNVFRAEDIVRRVDEIATGLQQQLAPSHPQLALSIQQNANTLKRRIRRRAEVLERQFSPPPPPLELTSGHSVPVTGWTTFVGSGNPALRQGRDAESRTVLGIDAGNSLSSSSWRTRVALRAGRYQFEGRLRLNDVVIEPGDARGGAGLRISKGDMPKKLTGTTPWTEYKYAFSLSQDGEAELICELRALQGEVWFDAASLRLVRLP